MPQCPSQCGWYALEMSQWPNYACLNAYNGLAYGCTSGPLETTVHHQEDGNIYYTTTAPNWNCVPIYDAGNNYFQGHFVTIYDTSVCEDSVSDPPIVDDDNDGGHEQVICCAYSNLLSYIFQ